MGTLLKSDLLRIRKSTWVVMLLFPLLVLGMKAGDYMSRYDYLTSLSNDNWGVMIKSIHFYWSPAFVLGMTLLVSLIAGAEHKTDMWKKLFSLPISPLQVYQSKAVLILGMIHISILILLAGSYTLGIILGFHQPFPFLYMMEIAFGTVYAAGPLLFLQFHLSMRYKNQGIALTIGIASMVLVLNGFDLPDWLPWKWPLLVGIDNFYEVIMKGLPTAILIYVFSLFILVKREVD
ncbi:hypothetical protein D479_19798 [Halobacillus sp. BAB-2008]|nr:hypothetical protein D479_19798 [Halobacillus sp. BAB-2008]